MVKTKENIIHKLTQALNHLTSDPSRTANLDEFPLIEIKAELVNLNEVIKNLQLEIEALQSTNIDHTVKVEVQELMNLKSKLAKAENIAKTAMKTHTTTTLVPKTEEIATTIEQRKGYEPPTISYVKNSRGEQLYDEIKNTITVIDKPTREENAKEASKLRAEIASKEKLLENKKAFLRSEQSDQIINKRCQILDAQMQKQALLATVGVIGEKVPSDVNVIDSLSSSKDKNFKASYAKLLTMANQCLAVCEACADERERKALLDALNDFSSHINAAVKDEVTIAQTYTHKNN